MVHFTLNIDVLIMSCSIAYEGTCLLSGADFYFWGKSVKESLKTNESTGSGLKNIYITIKVGGKIIILVKINLMKWC